MITLGETESKEDNKPLYQWLIAYIVLIGIFTVVSVAPIVLILLAVKWIFF